MGDIKRSAQPGGPGRRVRSTAAAMSSTREMQMATRSKAKSRALLPESVLADLERRRPGLARHMTRAIVTLVRWDSSTGAPPQREALERTCEAGLDLFLATAREARPA